MNSLQPHKQVPCKVIANVDEGIKELAELLNTFDKVRTLESSEGDESGSNYAFIYIQYGQISHNEYKASAAFANKLKKVLIQDEFDFLTPTVSLEWLGTRISPIVILEVHPGRIKNVINVLSSKKSAFA